jgi:CRP/FNR family cyclic AMP-dependent transcriptional regulator
MNNITPVLSQSPLSKSLPPFLSGETEISVLPAAQTIYFLPNISSEALNALLQNARTLSYPKQSVIVSQGDEPKALFLITSGKVRILSADEKCRELTLNIQKTGSCFGEIALLANEPSLITAIALEKTFCEVISKNDFIGWLMNYPEVAFPILDVLSKRIRQLTTKIKQMAFLNVYERTVQILQEIAVAEGNIRVIRNRPSHQELASMVGASREMVSKIMTELTKGGYIAIEDKLLIINGKMPASW